MFLLRISRLRSDRGVIKKVFGGILATILLVTAVSGIRLGALFNATAWGVLLFPTLNIITVIIQLVCEITCCSKF